MVHLLREEPALEERSVPRLQDLHEGLQARERRALVVHVRQEGPLALGASPARPTVRPRASVTFCLSDRLCLARQITNDGTPNALTLGAFLADDETKAVIRDRSIVKTLSFKASLLGPLIPKVEAVANSDKWIFEAFSDGDDDDPPEAPAVFPPCIADEDVGGPSTSREAIRPKEPPPTVVGAKRKSSRA